MTTVAVAMSGGVDSSVAAALLQRQGFDVFGVTMRFQDCDTSGEAGDRFDGCCGFGAVSDAQGVARILGIPHYVLSFSEIFAEKVVADFCAEYARGRTPNPCIRCNQHIKFDAFLGRALALGADHIATGHYARIEKQGTRFVLRKGTHAAKDQAYVLHTMTQDQLERTLMPVGNLTKDEVRRMATEIGLPVAQKPESQEICFVPDNDYAAFVLRRNRHAAGTGPIVDREGNVLGQHHGIINYTIGQRRGLGIAAREPLYVLAIDPKANSVTVGSKEDVYQTELMALEVNWIAFDSPPGPMQLKARIRYLHREAAALVKPLDDGRVHVNFTEPQMAITPGQSVVFYDGDTVVGGGTIDRVGPALLTSSLQLFPPQGRED